MCQFQPEIFTIISAAQQILSSVAQDIVDGLGHDGLGAAAAGYLPDAASTLPESRGLTEWDYGCFTLFPFHLSRYMHSIFHFSKILCCAKQERVKY